jgi:hypothetical protein
LLDTIENIGKGILPVLGIGLGLSLVGFVGGWVVGKR